MLQVSKDSSKLRPALRNYVAFPPHSRSDFSAINCIALGHTKGEVPLQKIALVSGKTEDIIDYHVADTATS